MASLGSVSCSRQHSKKYGTEKGLAQFAPALLFLRERNRWWARCTTLLVGRGDEKQSAERAAAGDGVFADAGGAGAAGAFAACDDAERVGEVRVCVRTVFSAIGNGAREY